MKNKLYSKLMSTGYLLAPILLVTGLLNSIPHTIEYTTIYLLTFAILKKQYEREMESDFRIVHYAEQ